MPLFRLPFLRCFRPEKKISLVISYNGLQIATKKSYLTCFKVTSNKQTSKTTTTTKHYRQTNFIVSLKFFMFSKVYLVLFFYFWSLAAFTAKFCFVAVFFVTFIQLTLDRFACFVTILGFWRPKIDR